MAASRARSLAALERQLLAALRAARKTAAPEPPGAALPRPISLILYEAAFIRAFVAWERFLEESFMSYLLGRKPRRGRAPHRYYRPPNRDVAWRILREMSGMRQYVDWTDPAMVQRRAEVVFSNGGRFRKLGAANQDLQGMKKVRNAISHHSGDALAKFEGLVREKLETLPKGTTPGSFLGTMVPTSGGARTFLDEYLELIERLAQGIAGR
jgi:hypothetical protein